QALTRRPSRDPRAPAAAALLGSGEAAREDPSALRVARALVEARERLRLGRGEAARRVAFLAEERLRVEAALARVAEDAVAHAVLLVAGGVDRARDRGQLARRNVALRVARRDLRVEDGAREETAPRVRRRARQEAVEVLGEALRLHQRLAAAVRAAREVGTRGPLAVERLGRRLRSPSHLVD